MCFCLALAPAVASANPPLATWRSLYHLRIYLREHKSPSQSGAICHNKQSQSIRNVLSPRDNRPSLLVHGNTALYHAYVT
jgi:hypothetical protein